MRNAKFLASLCSRKEDHDRQRIALSLNIHIHIYPLLQYLDDEDDEDESGSSDSESSSSQPRRTSTDILRSGTGPAFKSTFGKVFRKENTKARDRQYEKGFRRKGRGSFSPLFLIQMLLSSAPGGFFFPKEKHSFRVSRVRKGQRASKEDTNRAKSFSSTQNQTPNRFWG